MFTSDIKNAGTDANVYMVVYGEKGKSDDIKLESKGDSFERGHMDTFKIDTVDVGVPYKIRIWHDNAGVMAGWHLDKVHVDTELVLSIASCSYSLYIEMVVWVKSQR